MARPMKVRGALLSRAVARLAALALIAAVSAGCSVAGRVIAPTIVPPRLLDPTAASVPATPPVATIVTGPVTTPQPMTTIVTGPVTTPVPGARTVRIVGTVESIDGAIWIVDGTRVRVEPTTSVAPGLGVGSLVRVTARARGDDDDDDGALVAISIDAAREVTLVGQITAIDPTSIAVDGRVIQIPPGFALPGGLAPGVIVRVVVDDEGGKLILRQIAILLDATVIGGTIEIIDGDVIIIGGQRLRLSPDVVLWRVRLVAGEPVRLIVIPINGVLTIITITIVTIIVPPPVVVMPVPTVIVQPPPVIVRPAPRPAPPSNSGSNDDDDDDDD